MRGCLKQFPPLRKGTPLARTRVQPLRHRGEILVKLVFGRGDSAPGNPCTFYQRKNGRTKRKLLLFAIGCLFTLMRLPG